MLKCKKTIKEMMIMKKYSIKVLSAVFVFVFICSAFAGCDASAEPDVISISSAGEIIADIHTSAQERYIGKSYTKTGTANGKKEKSRPMPVKFQWNAGDTDDYLFRISENSDMSDADVYSVNTNEIEIYNLKIAETYYWTVTINGKESEIKSFSTCTNAPRNLYVDGVTNVRDLGGWETEDGIRTNQNLIFRCGRLNESSAEKPVIEITDAGKEVMLYELGIKTEIDLRKTDTGEIGGITESPLGSNVQYVSCPMEWEGDTFNGNKEQLLKVFSILADENNYPVIFHCNIGTDRTGMIAYLINALLGVSDDNLHRDYLFSNFGNIGGKRNAGGLEESVYYKSVAEAEGDTLSEKAYHCLVDFGVPAEQLDAIRDILLPH